MKVMAFNGSPRKKWTTATLLSKALEGAASKGAKTELIHLYHLNFKGCISCFACKTIGGKSYGRLAELSYGEVKGYLTNITNPASFPHSEGIWQQSPAIYRVGAFNKITFNSSNG